MAANILEHDKGICKIETWHKLPQYKVMPEGQEIDLVEAQNIIEYNVRKLPLALPSGKVVRGANALVRNVGDEEVILYPSVGEDYRIVQNIQVFSFICGAILDKNPNVKIDSVGTLGNGRICFVNLDMGSWAVKKDPNGKTVTKLMYATAFGGKANTACVHDIRIVCQNTLAYAEAEGAANATLRRFGHYENIEEKYQNYIVDLSDVYLGIEKHKETLEFLSEKTMDTLEVKSFIDKFIPVNIISDKIGERKLNTLLEKRQNLTKIFDSAPDLQGEIRHTRFAMLQAVTNLVDHTDKIRNNNEIGNWYENTIFGSGKNQKQTALEILTSV